MDNDSGLALVDGQSTQGTVNRGKILAATVPASSAIQAEELMQLGRDESRALVRDHDVVYVYHNLIDKTGDTRDTEERVKEILRLHYVHRNEAGLVRSTIKEKGRHKVIDRISVSLNDKADVYEAEFANLGIKQVLIDSSTIKAHPKLLVGGVWCIADIEYEFTEDNRLQQYRQCKAFEVTCIRNLSS